MKKNDTNVIDFEEAKKAQLQGKDELALYNTIIDLIDHGKVDEAKQRILDFLVDDPYNIPAVFALLNCSESEEEEFSLIFEFIKNYKRIHSPEADDVVSFLTFTIGNRYHAKGFLKKSATYYKSLLAAPCSPMARESLYAIYAELEDKTNFDKLVGKYPEDMHAPVKLLAEAILSYRVMDADNMENAIMELRSCSKEWAHVLSSGIEERLDKALSKELSIGKRNAVDEALSIVQNAIYSVPDFSDYIVDYMYDVEHPSKQ